LSVKQSGRRPNPQVAFRATAGLIALLLLPACANTLNVLDDVRVGQSETQARDSVRETPKWTFENEVTKYLVYGFVATFLDAYDKTVTYYFVKLHDGKVVDKGMIGKRERNEIKTIDPDFDTDKLIRQPRNPQGQAR
jgi:hypothetical protein